MKYELKEMRWNMNNQVDNVTIRMLRKKFDFLDFALQTVTSFNNFAYVRLLFLGHNDKVLKHKSTIQQKKFNNLLKDKKPQHDWRLKKMRWNMNNEFDSVTSLSVSLMTLQVGQKQMLYTPSYFFFFVFFCLWNNSIFLTQFICLEKNSISSISRYLANYSTFLQIPLWFPDTFGFSSKWWPGNIWTYVKYSLYNSLFVILFRWVLWFYHNRVWQWIFRLLKLNGDGF